MKPEELTQGAFIKWEAARLFKKWDTYGKVVSLTEEDVTILTFDDFKETTLSKAGEAVKNEMELSTKEATAEYLEIRKNKLKNLKIQKKNEYFKTTNEIDLLISNLNSYEL